MNKFTLLPIILTLGSCGHPHRFEVSSDERIKSATLELNGRSSSMEIRNDHLATGELRAADADGQIVVQTSSGRNISCRIGYVTSGEREPHHFSIANGKCSWMSDG